MTKGDSESVTPDEDITKEPESPTSIAKTKPPSVNDYDNDDIVANNNGDNIDGKKSPSSPTDGSRLSLDSNDYLEAMGGDANDKTPKNSGDTTDDESGGYVDAINSTSVFSSPKGETYVPPPDE